MSELAPDDLEYLKALMAHQAFRFRSNSPELAIVKGRIGRIIDWLDDL